MPFNNNNQETFSEGTLGTKPREMCIDMSFSIIMKD